MLALFTPNAQTLPEDWWTDAEISIRPRDMENPSTPCAWDAGFNIERGNLMIEGSVCGHGIGHVKIKVPLRHGIDLYVVEFDAFHGNAIPPPPTLDELIRGFNALGYTVVDKDPAYPNQ